MRLSTHQRLHAQGLVTFADVGTVWKDTGKTVWIPNDQTYPRYKDLKSANPNLWSRIPRAGKIGLGLLAGGGLLYAGYRGKKALDRKRAENKLV